jgi:hypothetical protein
MQRKTIFPLTLLRQHVRSKARSVSYWSGFFSCSSGPRQNFEASVASYTSLLDVREEQEFGNGSVTRRLYVEVLMQVSLTQEGARGVAKDGGSKRRQAAEQLEAFILPSATPTFLR